MNQFGIDQVKRAADLIDPKSWDLVVSSPLGRARQSAEIVAERLGITQVPTHDLLLERAFGIGEGMLYEEWNKKFSQLDEIPGAESSADVLARAERLLEYVQSQYQGKKILSVSHGALIRFVLQVVTEGEIPPKGERLENASLNIVRRDSSWRLDSWSPRPLGG
jgi:broad specificity phosphatase PhoE